MKLTDGTRAYNALRARMTREKQRGSSCLMLPVRSIREIVPPLDPELIKFFIIAASYGNEVGTAWAGQREFMSYGYRSEDVTALMRSLEMVGLLRYVRQAQRDPVTRRFLPNVYQFNPALYFIRRRLRVEAASLSDRPFGDPKSLIRNSPSNPDHNQLVKPTTETSSTKPESRTEKQQQIPFEEAGEGFDSRVDPDAVRAANRFQSRIDEESDVSDTPKTKAKRSRSGGSGSSSAASAKQNPQTPSSAPPPSPALITSPLADPDDEAVAKRIKELGTHLPQARGLVAAYGRDRIVRAYDPLKAAIDKGSVKNAVGLLRKWLDSGMFLEKEFEPFNWDAVEWAFSTGQWETDAGYRSFIRKKYSDLIDHPGCPPWVRDRLTDHETSAAAD